MRIRVPPTLCFGRGQLAEVPAVLRELAVARPLVVTDPGVAAAGHPARLLGELRGAGFAAEVWEGAAAEPGEEHADSCRERIAAGGHDGVVALGGGSVIDVAKVAAVLATNGGRAADYFGLDRVRRPGLPLLAVPTTPGSGAEVSSHAVLIERARHKKEVIAGFHLLPRAAVVDPLVTLTLPPAQTTWSALDGLVHAIEAFLARRATSFTDAWARLAVPAIARALPRVAGIAAGIAAGSEDLAAREELCLGCLYSGLAMANANAGAIHALGYPLSGRYGIPHGLANALVAAAALERLWPGRPERCAELAALLGDAGAGAGGDPAGLAGQVRRLLAALGVNDRLVSWGVREEELPGLAGSALAFRSVLENAPVVLRHDDLLAVYRAAF